MEKARSSFPKYLRGGGGNFFKDLHLRVDAYFEERHLKKTGGKQVAIKVALLFVLYIAFYLCVLSNAFDQPATLLFAILFGLSNVLIGLNVAHDAGHGSLFESPALNRIFFYSFNLVGINAYTWDLMHNRIHHAYPNVSDYDGDIHYQAPLIRISPTEAWKPHHRFQAYYTPVVYMFSTLLLVFVKEYQDMGLMPGNSAKGQPRLRHSGREYGIFLLSKLAYYAIWILIPLFVLDMTAGSFIAGFLIVHMCMGLLTTSVLLTVHLSEEAPFAQVSGEHTIEDSHAEHVIKNTIDFSARSRVAGFLFGGLNTHMIHHLFPGICHIHHRNLTVILAQTAAEHGLACRNVSMGTAILSHFRFLKRMALPDGPQRVRAYSL